MSTSLLSVARHREYSPLSDKRAPDSVEHNVERLARSASGGYLACSAVLWMA
jgi:hypothetical protein